MEIETCQRLALKVARTFKSIELLAPGFQKWQNVRLQFIELRN